MEIQLRTTGQHYWAEAVERTASITGFNLKDGEGPEELLDYFRVASDLTWIRETGHPADPALEARLAELREQVSKYFRRTSGGPWPRQ